MWTFGLSLFWLFLCSLISHPKENCCAESKKNYMYVQNLKGQNDTWGVAGSLASDLRGAYVSCKIFPSRAKFLCSFRWSSSSSRIKVCGQMDVYSSTPPNRRQNLKNSELLKTFKSHLVSLTANKPGCLGLVSIEIKGTERLLRGVAILGSTLTLPFQGPLCQPQLYPIINNHKPNFWLHQMTTLFRNWSNFG